MNLAITAIKTDQPRVGTWSFLADKYNLHEGFSVRSHNSMVAFSVPVNHIPLFDARDVWLVVLSYLPLWKMMEWKSVGMMTFPMWWESHKIHVPNHQPDVDKIMGCENPWWTYVTVHIYKFNMYTHETRPKLRVAKALSMHKLLLQVIAICSSLYHTVYILFHYISLYVVCKPLK